MPEGALSGIIQDMRARQLAGGRGNDAMMRMLLQQQEMEQRAKEQANLKLWLMNNSPYLKLRQQKAADQAKQDKAMVDYVMKIPLDQVPIEWRKRWPDVVQSLAIGGDADLAKRVLSQIKPHGLQLKSTVVDNGDGTYSTEYTFADPNIGSMGPVSTSPAFGGASATPPMGAGSGVIPPRATPPSSSPRSLPGAAAHFYGKYIKPSGAPPPADDGSGD